ncbi:hypothetical protein Ancab_000950 [Ancistrocladus abbreviatus]
MIPMANKDAGPRHWADPYGSWAGMGLDMGQEAGAMYGQHQNSEMVETSMAPAPGPTMLPFLSRSGTPHPSAVHRPQDSVLLCSISSTDTE